MTKQFAAPQPSQAELIAAVKNTMELTATAVQTGLYGVQDPANLMVDAFFAGEHVLYEGVPGVGKTAMAENLAAAVTDHSMGSYGRVQGTKDTMPADIRGALIYNQETHKRETETGPIFNNILVVDEINRLPAATQAALNEGMNDLKVTIGKERLDLPKPFFVVATQNPHALGEATNPTPSSLLDRFGASLYIGSPSYDQRLKVIETAGVERRAEQVIKNISVVIGLREIVASIGIDEKAKELIAVSLTGITAVKGVEMRADGFRSAIAAARLSRAHAVRTGGAVVLPEHVRAVLPSVMRHRFDLVSRDSEAEKQAVIASVLGR